MNITDGFRRALRAWPMALLLTALVALLEPALELRERLAGADFGLGGFPFNIADAGRYAGLSHAEAATLAFLMLAWVFLSGGVIDRLARDTRSSSRRFFAAAGACFGPLIRLGLLSLATYAAVLIWIGPAVTRASDAAEGPARVALFGAMALLLFLIALVFDYARVRLVIEDRRSAIGALAASLRLIRAHPGRILTAQAVFWLALVLWLTLRAFPAVEGSYSLTYAFVAGEILFKLALIGTQASIYQQTLATAGWVAREDPRWPDEPSADPAAP
ncbi:MAG TPA: hypothetical protein VMN81_10875 [Vicinamibacterales bacterium]|nr:hypothetical protein [Vicinamibacterales bacterium]